ncbi:MAG: pantetheine-phosphate adenylyltransferase [Lachnospiraceae bacterium]
MKIAIYPGSFDPVTLGHLDMIERVAKVFDKLIIGILVNKNKTPLFSVEEKIEMLKEVTKHLPNIEIMAFEGLLIEFAKQQKASVIVRGLRGVTDFEYELQMAQGNQQFCQEVETMFLTTSAKYSYISSSMVKEIAHFGGDVEGFVPDYVKEKIKEKYHVL